MLMTNAILGLPVGIDGLLDFALALSAAMLLITLIVCWIRSGRDKL